MKKKPKILMASTLISTLILSVFNAYAADSDFWHSSIGAKDVLYNEVGFGNFSINIIKEDNSLWRWGYKNDINDTNEKPDFRGLPKKFFDDVKSSGRYYVLQNDGSLWHYNGHTPDNYNGNLWDYQEKLSDDVREAGETYAIKNDDSLWTYRWVRGEDLSLIKIMDNVRTAGFSYAIKNDGTLWTWGDNKLGELGTGNTDNTSIPIKILDNVKEACIGKREISDGCYYYGVEESGYFPRAGYAITSDNNLWIWGIADKGLKPFKVLDNVKEVSIFFGGFYALQENNDLWYIDYLNSGYSYFGHGYFMEPSYGINLKQEMNDVRATYTRGMDFYLLKNDNTLWKSDDGTRYKLNEDYDPQNSTGMNEFKQIMTDVKQSNSYGHALKTNGDLFINLGDEGYREEPLKNIKSFGRNHAIEEDGSLWLWDLLGTKEPILVLKPISK